MDAFKRILFSCLSPAVLYGKICEKSKLGMLCVCSLLWPFDLVRKKRKMYIGRGSLQYLFMMQVCQGIETFWGFTIVC